jgi:hypothetical protein
MNRSEINAGKNLGVQAINVGAPYSIMAYFAYKRSDRNRYLVIRWKKRINEIHTIVNVNCG